MPEETTLSPALAGMVAQLTMPQQYAKFVEVTVLSMNEKCPKMVVRIEK
jgi:hypothetical protein